MKITPLKNVLEICCYAAVITASLVFILNSQKDSMSEFPNQKKLSVNQEYESLKKVSQELVAKRTLFLAVSPDCPFCEKSIPFYRSLLDQRNRTNTDINIVMAVNTHVPIATQEKMANNAKISPDKIIQLDFLTLGISGVPTLFISNENGRVEEIRKGQLNNNQEEEVRNILFNL